MSSLGLLKIMMVKHFVTPDDKRVYVDIFLENNSNAPLGSKVLVKNRQLGKTIW
jgi:hypothetical protein